MNEKVQLLREIRDELRKMNDPRHQERMYWEQRARAATSPQELMRVRRQYATRSHR